MKPTARPQAPAAGKDLPRRNKQLRELVAALLDSEGSQREYLICVLLAPLERHEGPEPSPAERSLCANLIAQLLALLKSGRHNPESPVLEFYRLINHFPLNDEHFQAALKLAFPETAEPSAEAAAILRDCQLVYLLTELGEFHAGEDIFQRLQSLASPDHPCLFAVFRLTQARSLQQAGKRRDSAALWLDSLSEIYQREGAESALYLLLCWTDSLDWSDREATRKSLLNRFAASAKSAPNIISATLLYDLFTLEEKQVTPQERMNLARLLLRLPAHILTPLQLQSVCFFAGNYYSGLKLNVRQSIRYYQLSTFHLHRSWAQLQSVFRFLRENLDPLCFNAAMSLLERRVLDLESQMSLQNNAYVETLRDNYEQIRDLYRKVEELSVTDNLTGLKNRRFLANNLPPLLKLAERQKVPVCLAIADIDNFKRVNDAHGHSAGDQVLKSLARLLIGNFRKSDVIIRYGGEEFLLILFDTGLEQFQILMDELRRKVEQQVFQYKGKSVRITISIGIYGEAGATLKEEHLSACIERADTAMYLAKKSGRNRVVRYGS